MKATMKEVFCLKPKRALSALFLCLSLTACNDYPIANMPDEPLAQPLELIIEPKKVAMTSTWAAGIKEDGTLWTWGTDGLLRKTETGTDPTPVQVEGVDDAVAISGGSHMLLLKKDGTVWGWGYNNQGQIDYQNPKIDFKIDFISQLKKIEGLPEIVSISASSSNSFFIDKKGEVYVLGENETGLYGEPAKQLDKPIKIESLKNIVKIKGNTDHFLALDKDGNLYSSSVRADTIGGQAPEPILYSNGKSIYPPIQINLPKKVVDFDIYFARVVLLEDGTVWSWGNALQSAQGKSHNLAVPTQIEGLSQVVKIHKESAVTINGDFYVWGDYAYNCSYCFPNGMGSIVHYKPIRLAQNVYIDHYVDGISSSSYVDKQGWMWTWGGNYHGKTGNGVIPTGQWADKDSVLVLEKSLFTTH